MNGRNYVKLLSTKRKSGISDTFTTVNTPKSKKAHKSRRRRLKDKKTKVSKSSTNSIEKDKSDSFSVKIDEPETFAPTQILQRIKNKPISVNTNLLSPKKQKKILSILSGGQSQQKFSKSAGASPPTKRIKRTVSPTKIIKPRVAPPGFGKPKTHQTTLNKNDDKATKSPKINAKLNKEWNDKSDAYIKMLDEIDTNNIFEDIVPRQLLTLDIPNEINLGFFSDSIWNNSKDVDDDHNDGWNKISKRNDKKLSNPYSKEIFYSNPPIKF